MLAYCVLLSSVLCSDQLDISEAKELLKRSFTSGRVNFLKSDIILFEISARNLG